MKKTVFIDGQHGTTGLKIHDRLKSRDDLELIEIPLDLKKDLKHKSKIINEVDVVFLCLPDDAAKESVSLIRNENVRVLDPSTAHRTASDWVYGIPELNPEQRGKIRVSKRVSVPGCYATGFNMCMHPLVSKGIVPHDYPVSCYSITGYSGGGKQMIQAFENSGNSSQEICCRPKNLNLAHKHLPEMHRYGLLKHEPIFTPIVGNFYRGMLVFIPLYSQLLSSAKSGDEVRSLFQEYYKGEQFVRVALKSEIEDIGDGFVSPIGCNDTNNIDIFVFTRNGHILLVARLDNLGKGASGAAVQNMNIMIGASEDKGLGQ
jgi:N-acetyl-gamma-glutamyl-phosphate reductase